LGDIQFYEKRLLTFLEGIGIFSPSIKLDGTINIKFRPDKELVKELNLKNNLHKRIKNRENIGKRLTDLEKK